MNLSKLNMKYVDSLSGRQFEYFCADLFQPAYVTSASHDRGVDVIARDDTTNIRIGIQCKIRHVGAVGYGAIEELLAGMKYYHLSSGFVVTNGTFTREALADSSHMDVRLLDRRGLESYIEYEKYKVIQKHHKYSDVRLTLDIANQLNTLKQVMNYKNINELVRRLLRDDKSNLLNTSEQKHHYHYIKKMILNNEIHNDGIKSTNWIVLALLFCPDYNCRRGKGNDCVQ